MDWRRLPDINELGARCRRKWEAAVALLDERSNATDDRVACGNVHSTLWRVLAMVIVAGKTPSTSRRVEKARNRGETGQFQLTLSRSEENEPRSGLGGSDAVGENRVGSYKHGSHASASSSSAGRDEMVRWAASWGALTEVVRLKRVYVLLLGPLVLLPERVVGDGQTVEDVEGCCDTAGRSAAHVHGLGECG